MRRAGPAALAAMAAAVTLLACGGRTTSTILLTAPPDITVSDTAPPTPAGSLTVSITGQPTRTFIVHGGRWKVCDKGTVTNPGALTARDVRIVATYVDKGVVVGRTTREDAAADGGLLGDLAPGASASFTFCAITTNEPDVDRLVAAPGP